MINYKYLLVVFVLLMGAVTVPSIVHAEEDPLASPAPQPSKRNTAPEISGVNPDVVMSEGNQGETHPSDIFSTPEIQLPFPATPSEDDHSPLWMGCFCFFSMITLMVIGKAGIPGTPRALKDFCWKFTNSKNKTFWSCSAPPIDLESDPIQDPRYEKKTTFRGLKTVELEVPVFATRFIKVGFRGIKKIVPIYETRCIKVGQKMVINKVLVDHKIETETNPVYENHQVRVGTKTVIRKVPEYETIRVVVENDEISFQKGQDKNPKSNLNT